EKRLDAVRELALYRIAQEALSNIARHAQAKHASLVISFLPDSVSLVVKDDGIGFTLRDNHSAYAEKGHYGLLGVHERADLIGANLKVQSIPGKGTELVVVLPAQIQKTIA
ncbi:MAG: sensor histidine kinase, partial [Acidobacteriaceae bacterium]